ncbi:MAG: NAD-dependent epimerase/dehydratase family protein [Archangiaceae bacterium]|nr:NAD-dependent epimerase/dehydratase family protein [Archangiaceae bacterium]
MNVFVTGGSGYVGRNLIRGLVSRGHQVRALARSDASVKTVEALGATAVRGDLLDEKALAAGLAGCQWLVHAAADTGQTSGNAAQERINIDGTRLLFRLARDQGVKRGVHVSTEAVLADGGPLVQVDETRHFPAKFAGGYSRSKALAEQAALDGNGGGLDVMVVRPRMVWGRDDTTLMPAFIKAAQSGQLAWIDGGRFLTSTTHVDNLVHALVLALEKGRAGRVYFVSDGDPVPFRDFVTELLETQHVKAPTREVPRWLAKGLTSVSSLVETVSGGKNPGPLPLQTFALMAHEVTVNDARAREELGYAPVMARATGLDELKKARG